MAAAVVVVVYVVEEVVLVAIDDIAVIAVWLSWFLIGDLIVCWKMNGWLDEMNK